MSQYLKFPADFVPVTSRYFPNSLLPDFIGIRKRGRKWLLTRLLPQCRNFMEYILPVFTDSKFRRPLLLQRGTDRADKRIDEWKFL
jgi:hypothetical protein